MGKIEISQPIAAPLEQVWQVLSQPEALYLWGEPLPPPCKSAPGYLGLGSRYRQHLFHGWLSKELYWQIIAFDPPTHQVHESISSLISMRLSIDLLPLRGHQTQLQMLMRYQVLPGIRPANRFLQGRLHLMLNQMLETRLTQLKHNIRQRVSC